MADNVMAIQAGRLSLSRIVYRTDLQSTSGLIIPLGVIAEVRLAPWRALGLIARTQLLTEEIESIGRLIRAKLAMPFNFLLPEFESAASDKSGEALSNLAQRFSESLFFAPPQQKVIREVLPITAESVLTEVRKARDHDFYLMLAEAEEDEGALPSDDRASLLAA
jgi:hypothetical protein